MRRICVTAMIFVMFLVVLGFGQQKILHWNLETDPETLDPSYATSTSAQQIDHALFLGLTGLDEKTLKVIPRLASAWEVSKDNLAWTFHLRRDAMWSDGTPVTAHDITFAIERTLNPADSSPLAHELYVLRGAEAYHSGNGRARDIGVRAIDNHTVRFTLAEPIGCFPALVESTAFYPQPRSIVEDYGTDWIKPEHIVSDGPYVMGQWVNDRIILYKSTTYYAADKVNIDEVYCYMISGSQEALAMYKQGKLDVVRIASSDIARVKNDTILRKELRIAQSQAVRIGDSCTIPVTYTYPLAELTKPYVTRTYAPLGREKWEDWNIR